MALKPPVEVPQGAIRLNTDSQKLEFFAQDQWWEMATEVSSQIAGRGVFGSNSSAAMDYIQIQTRGNAVDFGDALDSSYEGSSGASNTRGVTSMGYTNPGTVDTIQYITIATQGNAVDFGNNTAAERRTVGCSNQTRAMFTGSEVPSWTSGQTDIITISSTGDATDFGDTSNSGASGRGAGSATRALYIGGRYVPSQADANVVEYVTIQSTGTWRDFGDLAEGGPYGGSGSNATRAVYTCDNKKIDFATIATLGNWQTFGELVNDHSNKSEGAADSTRCVFGNGGNTNVLEYITFHTTGNAVDFGDATQNTTTGWSLSNAHGGLG